VTNCTYPTPARSMPSPAESSNLITAILEARPSTAADERVLEASRRRGQRRSAPIRGVAGRAARTRRTRAESAGGQTSRVLLSRTVEQRNERTKTGVLFDYLRGHASAIGVGAARRALYRPPAPNFPSSSPRTLSLCPTSSGPSNTLFNLELFYLQRFWLLTTILIFSLIKKLY
jgi:hypothetical protein